MLLLYAKVRGLKRWIFTLPVMTPKLSSYWLYFITATSYKLATALVSSMKIEVVCRDTRINEILDVKPVGYETALERTFSAIDAEQIISSWKDSLISGRFNQNLSEFINVPSYGCYKDERVVDLMNREKSRQKIWRIGGEQGWYYGNWLWRLRGYIDKLVGGVGLRRGRTDPNHIAFGDAIDFWRVIYVDPEETRLLLFAEMKLPGEAWLEFKISRDKIIQVATFRPKGLWGRIYWYSFLPLHYFIFNGMIKRIAKE
jgi:hypothetical protein